MGKINMMNRELAYAIPGHWMMSSGEKKQIKVKGKEPPHQTMHARLLTRQCQPMPQYNVHKQRYKKTTTDEPKKGKEKGSPLSCHAAPLHPAQHSTALASVILLDAACRPATGPARLNGPQRHWPNCYK